MKKKAFLSIILLCVAPIVFATNGGDVISGMLENLVGLLQSKMARLSAVVAFIYVGYSTLYLGRMQKDRACAVVLGLGIIFSAGFIMEKLGYGV